SIPRYHVGRSRGSSRSVDPRGGAPRRRPPRAASVDGELGRTASLFVVGWPRRHRTADAIGRLPRDAEHISHTDLAACRTNRAMRMFVSPTKRHATRVL